MKIFNEFIEVLKICKFNEVFGNIVVLRIVVDVCDKFCKSYLDKVMSDNDFYKICGFMLNVLFVEVFVIFDGECVNSFYCSSVNNVYEDELSIVVVVVG